MANCVFVAAFRSSDTKKSDALYEANNMKLCFQYVSSLWTFITCIFRFELGARKWLWIGKLVLKTLQSPDKRTRICGGKGKGEPLFRHPCLSRASALLWYLPGLRSCPATCPSLCTQHEAVKEQNMHIASVSKGKTPQTSIKVIWRIDYSLAKHICIVRMSKSHPSLAPTTAQVGHACWKIASPLPVPWFLSLL